MSKAAVRSNNTRRVRLQVFYKSIFVYNSKKRLSSTDASTRQKYEQPQSLWSQVCIWLNSQK